MKMNKQRERLPQVKTPNKKLQVFLNKIHDLGYIIESIEDNNYILRHGNTRMVIEYKEDEPVYQTLQRLHLNHKVMIEADIPVSERAR